MKAAQPGDPNGQFTGELSSWGSPGSASLTPATPRQLSQRVVRFRPLPRAAASFNRSIEHRWRGRHHHENPTKIGT